MALPVQSKALLCTRLQLDLHLADVQSTIMCYACLVLPYMLCIRHAQHVQLHNMPGRLVPGLTFHLHKQALMNTFVMHVYRAIDSRSVKQRQHLYLLRCMTEMLCPSRSLWRRS